MRVFLTFADDEKTVRTRLLGPTRRVPAGRIHAAAVDAEVTLCGIDLGRLREFGRSRHPFERFSVRRRCATCHQAAGRPGE